MFEPDLYQISDIDHAAELRDGAFLYRITSSSHASRDVALNGRGPLDSRTPGRFNRSQQSTTYCATNVYTAIAESLYHLYRALIQGLRKKKEGIWIRNNVKVTRSLIVMRVKRIPDLTHIDSETFIADFGDSRVCGTMLVLRTTHTNHFGT